MRLLEYRQDLLGRGYWVTSGNKHYEEGRERECPPIRMCRLIEWDVPCDCFNDLVESLRFNYNLNEGTKEEHLEKYASILLGKSPEWIITGFQVPVGEVYVDLYNTKTDNTSFFSLEADEYGFDLRFEVPYADDRPCAIYDVRIEGVKTEKADARTTVTENINNVRREIEFFRKPGTRNEIYIEVTEYADL